MGFAILLVGWCVLVVLSWPVALALLVLAPTIWLLTLPFRLLGLLVDALFTFLRAVFILPARLLGHKP
jgi:hypothetical protein